MNESILKFKSMLVNYINIVANIVTVVLFPITIYQIATLKNRVEKAQQSMNKILQFREYQKMSKMLELISMEHKELTRLIYDSKQKGVKISNLHLRSQEIIENLEKCVVEIPQKYDNLMDIMYRSAKEIQKYMENGDIKHLKEAQDYLYSCIKQLKILDSNLIKEEIELIASDE